MKRALAVALIVAAVVWVRQIGATSDDPRSIALALGFTLVVAMVTGDVLRRFRLPRLTGYLLFGMLVGPYLANVITEPMARQLQTVNGIATTLIALIAGLTLNLERLGRRLAAIAQLTMTTIVVADGGAVRGGLVRVAVAAGRAGRDGSRPSSRWRAVRHHRRQLLADDDGSRHLRDRGARAPERSRARDGRARRPRRCWCCSRWRCSLRASRSERAREEASNVLVRLAWEIGGAIAFGSLVGALFALYLRYVGREVTLVLLAVCALLSQVGATQGFEPLLAAMAAGLVIENVAVAAGRRAQGRDSTRGAAGARRVLRRRRHVAAARRAGARLASSLSALVAVRIALIRLGVLRGRRVRGRRSVLRRLRLDGSHLAGRHHARSGVGPRGGVSDAGASDSDAARGADRRSTSWSGRSCSGTGWRRRERSTPARRGR